MRAKFIVESVTNRSSFGKKYQIVLLHAQYATISKDGVESADTENNQFAEATPSGRIEMSINNPKAIDFFKPEMSFYIDFTEAPIKIFFAGVRRNSLLPSMQFQE